jgi:N-acetylglutamate synthase-like GNAT family acetyltransferase
MLAIIAEKNGEILAMVAANDDSKTMWQMGIDVLPEYKGLGIGSAMVTLLKNMIMDAGILPYYGTAASHIKSQLTAVKAGFIPGWLELCTMSIEELKGI